MSVSYGYIPAAAAAAAAAADAVAALPLLLGSASMSRAPPANVVCRVPLGCLCRWYLSTHDGNQVIAAFENITRQR